MGEQRRHILVVAIGKLLSVGLGRGKAMVKLIDFQEQVVRTDRRPNKDKTRVAVMGVFGELGSLMSEFKKRAREGPSYQSFSSNLVEEAGDLLWYLTALGLDLGITLDELISAVWGQTFSATTTFSSLSRLPNLTPSIAGGDGWLLAAARAGEIAAAAHGPNDEAALRMALITMMRDVVVALQASKISISKAAAANLTKSATRFPIAQEPLPLYDDLVQPNGKKIPVDEKLPRRMDFDFEEVEVRGRLFVVQKVYSIKIGDPLTDNISEKDDYKFHDVFHLAYASVLGWSPVLRALLKVKRKSFADLDENQDGARAILIEEGISTLVFNWAKPDYLEGVKRVDYNLLNTIAGFVKGYEVENQPFWAWEKAILRGYDVFRQLKEARKGRVTMDLQNRDIYFTKAKAP